MMSLTCNKKAYPQFKEECDKCPMKTECVDNGKSVAVGLMELRPINVTLSFGANINNDVSVDAIADKLSKILNKQIQPFESK